MEKNKKMLICEDQKGIASAMAEYYEKQGYVVDVANSFAEVKRTIKEVRYDVILCDTIYSASETNYSAHTGTRRSHFIEDLGSTTAQKPINATTPMIILDYSSLCSTFPQVDRLNVVYSEPDTSEVPVDPFAKTDQIDAATARAKIIAANIGIKKLLVGQLAAKL